MCVAVQSAVAYNAALSFQLAMFFEKLTINICADVHYAITKRGCNARALAFVGCSMLKIIQRVQLSFG